MGTNRIKLIVEGADRDDGHVRLEVFVRELEKLKAALVKADEKVSEGRRCTFFAVVGLSHSSPATVEIEARVRRNCADTRSRALKILSEAIQSVERGEFTESTDYEILSDIRDLASPVGESLKSALLVVDQETHYLTTSIASRIADVMSDVEECHTTIEGMLEKINVHAQANLFTIYPDVGPSRITCKFPEWLAEKGISGVRRRVAVSGLAKYRKYSSFPHELTAEAVEIYGVDEDLPSFDELKGIAPEATGDLSSEEFVRELRHDWH